MGFWGNAKKLWNSGVKNAREYASSLMSDQKSERTYDNDNNCHRLYRTVSESVEVPKDVRYFNMAVDGLKKDWDKTKQDLSSLYKSLTWSSAETYDKGNELYRTVSDNSTFAPDDVRYFNMAVDGVKNSLSQFADFAGNHKTALRYATIASLTALLGLSTQSKLVDAEISAPKQKPAISSTTSDQKRVEKVEQYRQYERVVLEMLAMDAETKEKQRSKDIGVYKDHAEYRKAQEKSMTVLEAVQECYPDLRGVPNNHTANQLRKQDMRKPPATFKCSYHGNDVYTKLDKDEFVVNGRVYKLTNRFGSAKSVMKLETDPSKVYTNITPISCF